MNCKRDKPTTAVLQFALMLLLSIALSCTHKASLTDGEKFVSVIVDPHDANVELFWQDETGKPFKSIQNLKNHLAQQNLRLTFAMNGGIYERDNLPTGLFVQNQNILVPLDEKNGDGNFYLKPNGVFYLTTNDEAFVTPTEKFSIGENVKFATQSGPMLIVEGKINRVFDENSTNLYIRNGVGILPNGKIAFVISRQAINFHEFARYFQSLNCREALYLDGFVSRMYFPEGNLEQLDGDFAVIIGVIKKSSE